MSKPVNANAELRKVVESIVDDAFENTTLMVDDSEIERIAPIIAAKVVSMIEVEVKEDEKPAAPPAEVDYARISKEVIAVLAPLCKPVVKRHEFVAPNGKCKKVEGPLPACFDRLRRLAMARKNIMLVGPSGCGKTFISHLLAGVLPTHDGKKIGLDFGHLTCTAGMSEGQILGRLLPTGKGGAFKYERSDFVRCYEEGGVFLFDEFDAADSNTALIINTAIANGKLALPSRPDKPYAERHPDFICIAACNTFGTGADRQYVGRNQMDESTLDRFRIGQIVMDYDVNIEASLCPDDALRTLLQGYRTKADQGRVRRIISTRFLKEAYEMLQVGDSIADIEGCLFAGWSKDELAKVGKY